MLNACEILVGSGIAALARACIVGTLLFAVALSVLTGVLFGAMPALRAARRAAGRELAEASVRTSAGRAQRRR